jgi:Flp pilus assembly protein TadG
MAGLSLRPRSQRGAAVVEFALVSTLLMTLVIGVLSYGYMLSFRQAISQGAAEGARSAAVAPAAMSTANKQTRARNAVNEALDSYGVQCTSTNTLQRAGTDVGTCTITLAACTNNTAETCASVDIDYLYRQNALVPSFPGLGVVLPTHLAYTAVAEVS